MTPPDSDARKKICPEHGVPDSGEREVKSHTLCVGWATIRKLAGEGTGGNASAASRLVRWRCLQGVAGHAAFWEAKLATEHAALRWERVARRWNYKHRGAGGLSERDRDRVWMHWLQQMDRRFPRWEP